jgi:hypothetical protein
VKNIVSIPSSWEEMQLKACKPLWEDKYNICFRGGEYEDNTHTLSLSGFIKEITEFNRENRIDGIISSSDYPGCLLASLLAEKLNLPGPLLKSLILCSHKYYSREIQKQVIPEATPAFALIDPENLSASVSPVAYPFFLKPVKSVFSLLARPVNSFAEMNSFLASAPVRSFMDNYISVFNEMLAIFPDLQLNGSNFMAEEIMTGGQVTVEGYVFEHQVEIIGITDSIMYPGTISFQRFEYPSSYPPEVQVEMENLARKIIGSIGFNNGVFNIEMFYNDKTGKISIIEINPRMCGQFADLMEKVNGTNTFEILLAMAVGEKPVVKKYSGKFKVAASFVLRLFENKIAIKVPEPQQIEQARQKFPGFLFKSLVKKGEQLAGSELPGMKKNDCESYRYAVFNMGGENWASLYRDFEEAKKMLAFEFADL